MLRIYIYFCFFYPLVVFGQNQIWYENNIFFNPSGVEINSLDSGFRVVDWNMDSYPDILVLQNNELTYYEHNRGIELSWTQKNINLPLINAWSSKDRIWSAIDIKFDVVDLEGDGDWDIVSDSLFFYENTSSNQSPNWEVHQDYFKSRIEPAFTSDDTIFVFYNIRFLDFNGDGKQDFLTNIYSLKYIPNFETVYLFLYSDSSSIWYHADSIFNSLDFYNYTNIDMADFDNDDDYDVMHMDFFPHGNSVDIGYEFHLGANIGGGLFPVWIFGENTKWPFSSFSFFSQSIMFRNSQFYDMSHDDRCDYIYVARNRNLEIFENNTVVEDELCFERNQKLIGRVNVESEARPFLFQSDTITQQLIVSENHVRLWDFQMGIPYTSGRLRVLGAIDSLVITPWEELDAYWGFPANTFLVPQRGRYQNYLDFFINFSVDPFSSETGVAVSCLRDNVQGPTITSNYVEYHTLKANGNENVWQTDTTYLAFFDDSELKFSQPYLVNLDEGIELELFIKQDSIYNAYQNTGSRVNPNWQQAPELLSGIENFRYHHITFVDLDKDFDQDLIFGKADGTLDYYENLGVGSQPLWQKSEAMFVGIDVGDNAAPVVGDFNEDGYQDLIIGNKDGFLYHYESQIIISVEEKRGANLPNSHVLNQNYPNPFNPSTQISFSLAKTGQASLKIYNIKGQLIDSILDKNLTAGSYELKWNASGLPSGIYIYKLTTKSGNYSKKLVLIK